MEQRPKLSLTLTTFDKAVELMSILLLIIIWIACLANYEKLPNLVPSHFSLSGEADGFREKSSIFLLSAIATLIFTGMTIINRYPHKYNYLTPVTGENASKLYSSATRMIRIMKLIVMLVFAGVLLLIFRTA